MAKTKRYNSFTDNYQTYDTSNGYGDPKEWRDSFYERMSGETAKEILKEKPPDSPWTILGVSKGVTFDVIKRQFRTLAMANHPDKHPGKEKECNEKMREIIAAYTIIKEHYGQT